MGEDLRRFSKCKIEKTVNTFHKDKDKRNGLYKQRRAGRQE